MPLAQAYLGFVLMVLFCAGCSRTGSVESFEAVPMEKRLQWQLPAGWSPRYDGDGIRWGSFVGPQGAVITLTRFPGSVGDELMNINRWRGQLGLDPLAEAHMEKFSGSLEWRWVWLENSSEILAGAMTPIEGTTLTLKLSAHKPISPQLRADFLHILQEITWQ